jgi:hypothetical protein
MEVLLDFCRTKLGLKEPQCRASDGSLISSESHFGDFDAFHIVDMHETAGTESTSDSTTSPNVLRGGPAPYPILGNIPHVAYPFRQPMTSYSNIHVWSPLP